MKIAVIGTGPLAIEMAVMMHREDAEVVLFGQGELGGATNRYLPLSFLSSEGSWGEITTESGRGITGIGPTDVIPTIEDYHRLYLKKLIDYCHENIQHKKFHVERVHKRFLGVKEEVPGKSRLEDLFRVVHTRSDEDGDMEFFDDFDIVIEAIGPCAKEMAGPAGNFAVNERLNGDEIDYSLEPQIVNELLEFKGTIAIVGNSAESAALLLFLKSWLGLDEKNSIYLIQSAERAFEKLAENYPYLDEELTKFINDEKTFWQQKCREVEKEIENYRVLPREEQIKYRIPEFPDPRLKILTGYTVTSIDNLSDRDGLFLTLETPAWNEQGNREIFTINTGKLFVLKGANPYFLGDFMRMEKGPIHLEPGYYSLGQDLLAEKKQYLLKEALPSVSLIRENILSFFTRVD